MQHVRTAYLFLYCINGSEIIKSIRAERLGYVTRIDRLDCTQKRSAEELYRAQTINDDTAPVMVPTKYKRPRLLPRPKRQWFRERLGEGKNWLDDHVLESVR